MWTVFSVCTVLILAIYGITEILKRLWIWLLNPKDSPPTFLTLILKDDIYKEQLRFAEEYLSWEGEKLFSGILVVDKFLSDENKSTLNDIINKKHNISVLTKSGI